MAEKQRKERIIEWSSSSRIIAAAAPPGRKRRRQRQTIPSGERSRAMAAWSYDVGWSWFALAAAAATAVVIAAGAFIRAFVCVSDIAGVRFDVRGLFRCCEFVACGCNSNSTAEAIERATTASPAAAAASAFDYLHLPRWCSTGWCSFEGPCSEGLLASWFICLAPSSTATTHSSLSVMLFVSLAVRCIAFRRQNAPIAPCLIRSDEQVDR